MLVAATQKKRLTIQEYEEKHKNALEELRQGNAKQDAEMQKYRKELDKERAKRVCQEREIVWKLDTCALGL